MVMEANNFNSNYLRMNRPYRAACPSDPFAPQWKSLELEIGTFPPLVIQTGPSTNEFFLRQLHH